MKRITVSSTCFLAVISFATGNAQVVLSENFDAYQPGALVGQGNWTQLGTSTVNPIQVTAAQAVALADNGQDAQKAFSSQIPHTDGDGVVTAFSLTLSSAKNAGDYFVHLTSPAAGSPFYNRIYAQAGSTAGTFRLGLSAGTPTAGTTPIYGGELMLGQTYQVATTWTFVSGSANDTFSMRVDGAPYINEFSWNTATVEPTAVALFNLRQGTAAEAPVISAIDNILVTQIPEPSTFLSVMFGAGTLLLGARGRRV